MGVFDWPLTVIGQNAPSVECPYGPRAASATRLCGGNFVAGGIWKDPDVNRCKYKSERTNKLNKLAKVGAFFSEDLLFCWKFVGFMAVENRCSNKGKTFEKF